MFDALVFSTVNALEFSEIRRNVIRIPEVIHRIREAQSIWDQTSDRNLDLGNFIGSDDQGFLGNLRLKNLATAVIQLGLLDRLFKTAALPNWILGLGNGDAPIRVAARQETFDDLIRGSQVITGSRSQSVPGFGNLPILAGVSLAEFTVLKREESGYVPVLEREMDIRKALKTLVAEAKPQRVVVVGPSQSHIEFLARDLGSEKIEFVDSVTLDPLLGWFYREQEDVRTAAN